MEARRLEEAQAVAAVQPGRAGGQQGRRSVVQLQEDDTPPPAGHGAADSAGGEGEFGAVQCSLERFADSLNCSKLPSDLPDGMPLGGPLDPFSAFEPASGQYAAGLLTQGVPGSHRTPSHPVEGPWNSLQIGKVPYSCTIASTFG